MHNGCALLLGPSWPATTKLPYDKENVFLVFFLHPEAPIQILLPLLCGMPQALFCLIDLFLQEDSGIVVVVVVLDSFDLCVLSTLLFWEGKKKKK